MDLTDHSTDARAIFPCHNEQILRNETHLLIHLHNLNMREPLTVGTDLILALNNKDSFCSQSAICLTPSIPV